jgi:hypothetical protein
MTHRYAVHVTSESTRRRDPHLGLLVPSSATTTKEIENVANAATYLCDTGPDGGSIPGKGRICLAAVFRTALWLTQQFQQPLLRGQGHLSLRLVQSYGVYPPLQCVNGDLLTHNRRSSQSIINIPRWDTAQQQQLHADTTEGVGMQRACVRDTYYVIQATTR